MLDDEQEEARPSTSTRPRFEDDDDDESELEDVDEEEVEEIVRQYCRLKGNLELIRTSGNRRRGLGNIGCLAPSQRH
jgi:hypothetical protein